MRNGADVVTVREFGVMPDGTPVQLYTVRHGDSEASFTDYGARVVSVVVPDGKGVYAGVVLGFDSLEEYRRDKSYQGATIGRLGNRLALGQFELDGRSYQVPVNNGVNSLHGGLEGFDRRVWAGTGIENGVEFTLVSPDGDQGYPGTLIVVVRFTFLEDVLRIVYSATCDAPTVVNLTNHTYFNLAGESSGTIVNHEIALSAAAFTPVDATLIPTGELRMVQGSIFDWRQILPIREGIDEDEEQVQRAGGWDHNWVLGHAGEMKLAAELYDPATDRSLIVETTEPGIQFYSGNFLDGSMPNRKGGRYEKRSGLCLETQHFPDSPNHPEFPSTELRPDETFRSVTTYKFVPA